MSDTRSLPLIPLEDGIVLPGMAFVYELVSSDANVAVDEAGPDGHVVLVPKVDGRFARIGVVAIVEGEPVMLPGGHRGVTLRVLHRAELGRADASGGALRIDVTERPDPTEITEPIGELMRAYRAVIESILEARDRGRAHRLPALRRGARRAGRHGRLLARPHLRARSSSCSRRSTSASASRRRRLGPRRARRPRAEAAHPRRRHRRHGEEPARVPAAPPARRDPQGARRGRRDDDEIAELPRAARRAAACRRRPAGGRARARRASSAGAQSPEGATDPHLARLAPRRAVGQSAPTSRTTSRARARSSRPTTPA